MTIDTPTVLNPRELRPKPIPDLTWRRSSPSECGAQAPRRIPSALLREGRRESEEEELLYEQKPPGTCLPAHPTHGRGQRKVVDAMACWRRFRSSECHDCGEHG